MPSQSQKHMRTINLNEMAKRNEMNAKDSKGKTKVRRRHPMPSTEGVIGDSDVAVDSNSNDRQRGGNDRPPIAQARMRSHGEGASTSGRVKWPRKPEGTGTRHDKNVSSFSSAGIID